MLNNSSMFQPGLNQSSAWKWHARIGCSPDETCGATRPGSGAMKCVRTYYCVPTYEVVKMRTPNIQHRISNFEGVRFTSCVSPKLFVRTYYDEEEFRLLICSKTSSMIQPGLSQSSAWQWHARI